MRVALVVMPFAAITRPSLAVGLLQANLRRVGIHCDAIYANLTLGAMLGAADYRQFSNDAAITALAGEWAFSQVLLGDRLSTWDAYRRDVLDDPDWGAPTDRHPTIQALATLAPSFLDRVYDTHDWASYDLVGFTSTFEQTMPSLCLAQMIRERHPQVLLAIGGANFEAPMGQPYLDHFPFLDFVSTAEADTAFTVLCTRLRAHRAGLTDQVGVPASILFRDNPRTPLLRVEPEPPVDLESSPTPAYDDFYAVADALQEPALNRRQWLPLEAARGCWWGEKVHCTFCGLNGDTMRFRAKSAGRVIEESRELVARHGTRLLQFADNILGADYFQTLLPRWAQEEPGVHKFFEIRSNLSRDQLALLKRAGVTAVQAGIESLSDRTLHIMGKGVFAAQNLALLRWCAELGIDPLWNLIYAFPGEDLADYERMDAVARVAMHLPPPDAIAPIRMDRFSPNFAEWRTRGFTDVEPMAAYRHVFPFSDAELATTAYYFRYEHAQLAAARERGLILERTIGEWRRRHRDGRQGRLVVEPRGDTLALVDSRDGDCPSERVLSEVELAWLEACDRPASRSAAAARAARRYPASTGDLQAGLAGLMTQHVIVEVGDRLVTLALLPAEVRDRLSAPAAGVEWPLTLVSTTE